MDSWSSYSAKAWFNSATLIVTGKKEVIFKDGTRISWNVQADQLNNILFGTMQHMLTGKIVFTDEKNGIEGMYDIYAKKKPGDFLYGWIKKNGKEVSKVYGNYMGFMDFDGKRYWDIRESPFFDWKFNPAALESDSDKRIDSVALRVPDVQEAQVNKDTLENL